MIHVTFVGNLGADAELREVEGTPVLNFRVGVKGGIQKDAETEWLGCAMWGTRGEKIKEHLVKGKQVLITGTLTSREYEHNKETRFSLDVRVSELELLGGGSKSDEEERGAPPAKNGGGKGTERRASR